MISKYLENKIELGQDEGPELLENQIELEYYLIESESEKHENSSGNLVYGIEIVKKQSEKSFESEIVKNLSHDRERAQNLLNMLAKNKVTPMELTFILDDLMGI
ncbi:MAG: DUF6514 family protein [Bacillota bacterium]